MGRWKAVMITGLILVGASAVLLMAGFAVMSSNALLYVSVVASVVGLPLFLVGFVGYIVSRSRSSSLQLPE